MPFHPRIEFALNRIGILGSLAADEMNVIYDEQFENMIDISLESITHPEKFRRALAKERIVEIRKQQEKEKKYKSDPASSSSLILMNVHDLDHQQDDKDDDEEIVGPEEEEYDDDHDDEDPEELSDEEKIIKETNRIRQQVLQMSLVLLDSLRLSIDVVVNNNDKEEQEEKEPDVRLTNVPLVRLVLAVLSHSKSVTIFRVALLQGDLPLMARAIFRCLLPSSSNAVSSSSAISRQERNHLIFLLFDMIATMCSDSAACRIAFSCCVPQIVQILKTFVVVPAVPSSSTTTVIKKSAPLFVRPNSAAAAGTTSTTATNSADVISSSSTTPGTTDDDVIFAGAATLETMLFHCPESVEAFAENDGISVLVSLFRQQVQNAEKQTKSSNNSNPAETIAFIKRTLIHIRTCAVFTQEEWEKNIFSPENLVRIFGKQGDNLAVDELKWNLTGGIKAFMRK